MNRSVSTSIALFCALSILASFAFTGCGGPQANTNSNTNTNTALMSPAPATTVDCNSAGHDAIIKAVYGAISSDKKFGPQEWQFNITENGKVITIVGWSPDRDAIKDLVTKTALGCSFPTDINTTFVTARGDLCANNRIIFACPNGYAPCGDICIRVGDYCQLNSGPAQASNYYCTVSGTPGPTASPCPSASPSTNPPGNTAK